MTVDNTPAGSGKRAIVVGLGVHGRNVARIGAEAGIQIVAAIDPFLDGKDLSELTGSPLNEGIQVARSLEALDFQEIGADIAVVTVKAPVDQVVDLMIELLEQSLDVITLVEDVYDLRLVYPQLHERLDAAATAAGKSVLATGTQDIAWVGMTLFATGLVRDLRSIRMTQHLGVDGYPVEFLRWVGIGVSAQEWEEAARVAGQTPSVFGGVLPTIARSLGLTVSEQSREMSVFTLEHDIASTTWGRDILAGEPAGRRDIVTVTTNEGIDLSAELVTSVLMDQDDFTATIEGATNVEVQHHLDHSSLTVDATLINRIPVVLAARPGLLSTTELPPARYQHRL